jgi:hypothetical protein
MPAVSRRALADIGGRCPAFEVVYHKNHVQPVRIPGIVNIADYIIAVRRTAVYGERSVGKIVPGIGGIVVSYDFYVAIVRRICRNGPQISSIIGFSSGNKISTKVTPTLSEAFQTMPCVV